MEITIFEASFQNKNGTKQSAPIKVNIDKLYIVLDYNPAGGLPRGSDKKRDVIKFETASVSIPKNDKIVASHASKGGIDTLSDIGWKGIYAMNIEDAYNQVKLLVSSYKIKTIVLRTHGGVNQVTSEIAVVMDNNLAEDPILRSEDGYYVSTNILKAYKEEGGNHNYFSSKNYPKVLNYVEALIGLVDFVEEGGDFVVGSCHSADDANSEFLTTLQELTKSKVNMYGIGSLSSFKMTHDKQIVIDTERVVKVEKKSNTEISTIPYKTINVENGIGYVTRENTFSNTSLLKKTSSSFVIKISKGTTNTIRYTDLLLDKNGVVIK